MSPSAVMAHVNHHGHKSPVEEDDEDPVTKAIAGTGCLKLHYAVQECIAEKKDWRECQQEVANFRKCIEESAKSKLTQENPQ